MSPRTLHTRRRLPFALSLGAHALALAALAHFAPGTRQPARDPEPVTVRLAPQPSRAEAPASLPRAADRRALPAEAATDPILPQTRSMEDLLAEAPEESCACSLEVPASARRSALGVGALASLRAPRASAPQAPEACAGREEPAAPAACALACARAEQATAPVPLECAAP